MIVKKMEVKVNAGLVLTSPVSLLPVLRTHLQAAVVVSIRHLQEICTLQKSLPVLFRTLHQAAAFVTIQNILETSSVVKL